MKHRPRINLHPYYCPCCGSGCNEKPECPSCAAATELAEKAEAALRSVSGAVGEFADANGRNVVEKIEFLRRTYEVEVNMYRERYELEQIRYEGISSANDELRAEVESLKAQKQAIINNANHDYEERTAEVERLRTALEWVLDCDYVASHTWMQEEFKDELRRRAEGK